MERYMRLPWRRPQLTPTQRLLSAAGIDHRAAGHSLDTVGVDVAYRAARRGAGTIAQVLAVAEELVADEANYDLVLSLLEALQNLVSHRSESFLLPEEIESQLGERSLVCWHMISTFWEAVADWSREALPPLESGAAIRGIQNDQLRAIVWTANRSLPTGQKIGLPEAVRYENAGGTPLLGYGHIDIVLSALQNSEPAVSATEIVESGSDS